jgi:hypothetical protein
VLVRHGHNCPLLLHAREALAGAARALPDAVALDEAEATAASPSGAFVGGRALPHGPLALPADELDRVLAAEAERW